MISKSKNKNNSTFYRDLYQTQYVILFLGEEK